MKLEKNLTDVQEAYCHYFPADVLNKITLDAVMNPTNANLTRDAILKAIEPAADTRKKKYFIYKLNQMTRPMNMISYVFNSILKAQETPAYDYSYVHKNK